MRVSTRGDYASRALLSLALRDDLSTPTSVRDLAERTGLPIVAGDFGEPHRDGACDHEGQCVLLGVWADVGNHMREHLASFTLADMVIQAQGGQPVKRTHSS